MPLNGIFLQNILKRAFFGNAEIVQNWKTADSVWMSLFVRYSSVLENGTSLKAPSTGLSVILIPEANSPTSWYLLLYPTPTPRWDGKNESYLIFLPYITETHLSRLMTNPTKWLCAHRRPSLISVFAVRSMGTKDPSFFHADSEESDQTGRMPRLIWAFAGRTCHFVCFVMRRLILF